ncbi:pyridoxal phosphate-dependent aminotransferase [Alkalicella caledoniensis]|uniref:cysteine-S-conjugate beta-lyase n=1 Tax=Alkalicella caledoniensis TaxID=2731377 RepID=A0A7G9WBJ5_ALKCA|nr:MalY/PatB family protein [Alkalicella caledoniensis]QNO16057.1 pyridoxal phosphate-dependent aminotransferase [Alkalicella caledoniensis]
MYSFDKIESRSKTHSMKWDDLEQWFNCSDVIPMWVADMDFKSPNEVIEAVKARVEHGIFGYAGDIKPYNEAVINWFSNKYGWNINEEWICMTEGIVSAIHMLIQGLSEEGDKVLIQSPVYPPFYRAIKNNNRVLVENQLIYKNGRYEMDFDELDRQLVGVKIFILCSPHNPVGRVWSKEELSRVVELAKKHNTLIISDEIHGDLAFKDKAFTPMGVMEGCQDRLIVCTAPSKSFNIAGLHASNIIISNQRLRETFRGILEKNGSSTKPNVLGVVALIAAYNHGEKWLEEVINYIEGNFRYLDEFLKERIPKLKLVEADGTYLAWVDCSQLGIRSIELSNFFIEKCKVGMNPGYSFGTGGERFIRLNLGCSRELLKRALEQIEAGVKEL